MIAWLLTSDKVLKVMLIVYGVWIFWKSQMRLAREKLDKEAHSRIEMTDNVWVKV